MAAEKIKIEELESPKVEAASSPEASPASPPGEGENAPEYGTVIPNRIFVGGILPYTTEADLRTLFSNFGQVVSANIIYDLAGVSKGYGFVTFETEEEAKRLQNNSETIVLEERRLNIAPAIKKPRFGRLDTANDVAPSQIYYSNGVTYTYHNGMAFSSTSPQLMTSVCPPTSVDSPVFSCVGYPGGSNNMMSPAGTFSPPSLYTSTPMLFYQSPNQYQIAMENCWDGQAEMAYEQTPPVIPNRIFVGGISPKTTEADLTALFSNYGNVAHTNIVSDRAGVSKGYGFVTFETVEEAKRLQNDSGNIVLKGRRLNIAPAIKKARITRAILPESPLQESPLQYQPAPAHIVDNSHFSYFSNSSVVRGFQNNRGFDQGRPLQGRGKARGGNNQRHRGGTSKTPKPESPLTPPMTPPSNTHETTSPDVELTHSMQALSM